MSAPHKPSSCPRGNRPGRRCLLALPLAAFGGRAASGQALIEGLRPDPGSRLLEPGRDELARAFVAIAFGGDPGLGTPPRERLRRFEVPMEIGVVGEAAAEYGPWVARHAGHLAFLTGRPIRPVAPGGLANVLVVLSPDPARYISGSPWREMLGRAFASQAQVDEFFAGIRPQTLARAFASPVALTGEHIRFGIIAINTAHQPATVWRAIVEELSQMLGLLGDSPDVRNTIFSDTSPHVDLTEPDRWLLRVLYHPAIEPGMTRQQAQRAALSALTQLGYHPGRAVPAGNPAAPGSATYSPSAADVTRNFLRIAFAGRGEAPRTRRNVLARWDGGIRVALATDDAVSWYRGWVETHVVQLAHVTRQPIELVSPDAANLLVAVTADAAACLRRADLHAMLMRGFDDPDVVARQAGETAATQPCFRLTTFHDAARTRPRAATVVVSSRTDPTTVWGCIVQETAAALGMFGRDETVEWTVFNDRLPYVDLTRQDYAFLQLLYDPALRPGMTPEAVEAAICGPGRGCR